MKMVKLKANNTMNTHRVSPSLAIRKMGTKTARLEKTNNIDDTGVGVCLVTNASFHSVGEYINR